MSGFKSLVFFVAGAGLILFSFTPSPVLAQSEDIHPLPAMDPTPHILRISLLLLVGVGFLVFSRLAFRLRCPHCRAYIKASTKILRAPTSSEEGSSMTLFECPKCAYRKEKEQSIPVRTSNNRPVRGEVLTGKETGNEARRRARESFRKDMF